MKKYQKDLEEMATKITGIDPITDYEYQKLTYSKPSKGKVKQHRKALFKSSRRVI